MVGYESFSMRRSPWRLYSSYLLRANVSVKTAATSALSGSARTSQKQFQDTPRFKIQAVFARIQPFPRSNGVSERGDHPRTGRPSQRHYIYISRSRYGSRTTMPPHIGLPAPSKVGAEGKRHFFECFPYVRPEPVLVKC